jgi:hypothetical protein
VLLKPTSHRWLVLNDQFTLHHQFVSNVREAVCCCFTVTTTTVVTNQQKSTTSYDVTKEVEEKHRDDIDSHDGLNGPG